MPSLRLQIFECERIARECRYNIHNIAGACHLSVRHIERLLKNYFGVSAHEWLDEMRLRDAKERIIHKEPVKAVAYETGFKDTSHFYRRFKKRFGQPPIRYAREVLNKMSAADN